MIRRALLRDERGATLVEFALITPVLLMLLMGVFDLAYNFYLNQVLQGAVQKIARDSSIEGANSAVLDAKVTKVVHSINATATPVFSRTAYTDFGDVARPEDWTDSDSNGICDNGEPFEDANGNGMWDADRGQADSGGGARDAVLYTVEVSYPRMFPAAAFIGFDPNFTTRVNTVLRNQPYGLQETVPAVGNCA